MLLLGGAMLMPTTMMANVNMDGNDDNKEPGKPRAPENICAYISYCEATGIATVTFKTAINDAEIIILRDGVEVDALTINIAERNQHSVYLPAYGNGDFTIQVKSGSTLMATYSVTL